MLMLIRKSLKQGNSKLQGDVEVDETYLGGKQWAGRNNEKLGEAMKKKSVIVGAVKRGGAIKVQVSPNTKARTIVGFLKANVEPAETRLLTDDSNRYDNVAMGFHRFSVNHSKKEWVWGDVHTNTIESFWGHIKRSVRGVHKVVSKKYLQSYLDGFVFQHDNRHNDRARFGALLGVLLPA